MDAVPVHRIRPDCRLRRALLCGLTLATLAAPSAASRAAEPAAARPGTKADRRAIGTAALRDGPLRPGEVALFLRLWPVFEEAVATLRTIEPPGKGGPQDAEAALRADERIRRSLSERDVDPEAFLALHEKVSAAWWALLQAEDLAAADRTFQAQIEALETAARSDGKDASGMQAVREMRRQREALGAEPVPDPLAVPAASIEAVRAHREELQEVFGTAPAAR